MTTPLIYIAGPYRAETVNGIHDNIQAARKAAVELAKAGYHFICPHLNSAFMDGVAPDEFWLEMGIALLSKCDAVLIVGNWSKSEGTAAELKAAKDLRIPYFNRIDSLMGHGPRPERKGD